jgi:hypothetical protein
MRLVIQSDDKVTNQSLPAAHVGNRMEGLEWHPGDYLGVAGWFWRFGFQRWVLEGGLV